MRSWKRVRVADSCRSMERISAERPKSFMVPSSSRSTSNTAPASSSLVLVEASNRRAASSILATSSASVAIFFLSGISGTFAEDGILSNGLLIVVVVCK